MVAPVGIYTLVEEKFAIPVVVGNYLPASLVLLRCINLLRLQISQLVAGLGLKVATLLKVLFGFIPK